MSESFGQIRYSDEGHCWVIETKAHVALRLKRVFPKINGKRVGILTLSDTVENARDLEWFIERYPHDLDRPSLLKERSNSHRERETVISQLLKGAISSIEFPLAIPAREYQAQAAHILKVSGGLLCADDVGLGKTVTAIAAIIDPALRPCLVATLAHLPKQWRSFIQRFAPHLRVHILKKGTPYDLRTKDGAMTDVILSSYHKLSGWAETLSGIVKSVVWDECQELRHAGTWKYQAARLIAGATPWRLGLSATPIYNYGGEMFNVMNCIAPDALGSHGEFMTEWCHDGDTVQDPRAFGSYLRESGFMVRRTRADVGRELPACSSIPHPIECDAKALEAATDGCASLARIILEGAEAYRGEKMRASAEFDMRMRQATGIAKAPYVAEFVRMLVESGERVVLYAWHREVYNILGRRLEDLRPVLYTGTESVPQKDESKRKFIEGESKVLLISLRSGAGLDGLQGVCSTVVFAELDWSPGVHEQCIGRIHRDGQSKPVFAYYLLADEGSDPIVADTLGLKTQQIQGIRDPNGELLEALEVDPLHIKKLAQDYLKRHSHQPQPQSINVNGINKLAQSLEVSQ